MQCGVFGRWYKRRGDESIDSSTETVDGRPSHSRSSHTYYTPRTVPPLPGTEWKHGQMLLCSIVLCVCEGVVMGGGVRSDAGEDVKVDLGKEEEAERERQLEDEHLVRATNDEPL